MSCCANSTSFDSLKLTALKPALKLPAASSDGWSLAPKLSWCCACWAHSACTHPLRRPHSCCERCCWKGAAHTMPGMGWTLICCSCRLRAALHRTVRRLLGRTQCAKPSLAEASLACALPCSQLATAALMTSKQQQRQLKLQSTGAGWRRLQGLQQSVQHDMPPTKQSPPEEEQLACSLSRCGSSSSGCSSSAHAATWLPRLARVAAAGSAASRLGAANGTRLGFGPHELPHCCGYGLCYEVIGVQASFRCFEAGAVQFCRCLSYSCSAATYASCRFCVARLCLVGGA